MGVGGVSRWRRGVVEKRLLDVPNGGFDRRYGCYIQGQLACMAVDNTYFLYHILLPIS